MVPVGPGVARGDLVDRLYEAGRGSDVTDKRAFVVAAGGEL